MTVVFVGSQKGGPGKSTCAVNLTIDRALAGRRVLLIDTDPQGSSVGWMADRKAKKIAPLVTCVVGKGDGITDAIEDLRSAYDDIVVDCKGDASEEFIFGITVADVVVSPMEPAVFDVRTLQFLERLVGDVRKINPKLDAILVANKCGHHPNDKWLKKMRKTVNDTCKHYRLMDQPITYLSIYKEVADRARAISEMPKVPGYDKAIVHMQALAAEVW